MFQLSLAALVLWGGVLKEPFNVTEYQIEHNQVAVRAAMATDGRFAVAWLDSVTAGINTDLELFVRFFDNSGNPVTGSQKITKLADTNWIHYPCLAMDSAGNSILLWEEGIGEGYENNCIRFQLFDNNGNAQGTPHTVAEGLFSGWESPVGLGCNTQGKFAVTWSAGWAIKGRIWVRYYSADGTPQGEAFLAHDEFEPDYDSYFVRPQVGLNDAGDAVVTWLEQIETKQTYPRFQAFDAEGSPILAWEPMGYRIDDGGPYGGSRSQPHWLDNSRFVIFWVNNSNKTIAGRGFSDKGAIRYPIQTLLHDQSDSVGAGLGYSGGFASAVSEDERFALAYSRTYKDTMTVDNMPMTKSYYHFAGVIGKIDNDNPVVTSDIFVYSAPLGNDTIWRTPDNFLSIPFEAPAVAASNDRIVWVYSRINTDSTYEAWATITDWNMSSVEEQPVVKRRSDWQVLTSLGPKIVLGYSNHPQGFRASVFDASGRKVDDISSASQSGTITWGECYGRYGRYGRYGCYGCYGCYGPGVYFIKEASGGLVSKVVLVR